MPFIITDFVEFKADRASCPACTSFHGKKASNRNLSIIPGTDGAYKCHRGCTPAEIREALNYHATTSTTPHTVNSEPTPKKQASTASESEILTAAKNLEEGRFAAAEARAWLDNRGITEEIRQHFKLGISRRRYQGEMRYAIDIPLPDGAKRYYRKSRVAPWEGEKGWSQYGVPQHVFWSHKPEGFSTVWLVAGEWDAMLLGWQMRSQNDIAVATFTCGESAVPPADRLQELVNADTYIFYDLDEAGRSGAKKVAAAIGGKICELPSPDPIPNGWDISDCINAGYPIELLFQATATAQVSEAIVAPEQKKPKSLRDRLVTNDQLMARAPDLIEYLVPDLITSNELFVLATAPRGGKSLMAMALAHGVATGGKFLGRPCTQGSVIYVNLEDSDAKIKDREIQQGWGENLPIYWLDKFKLSELPELIDVAKDLNPRLIVLDTLSRIKDGATSEASAEMSQVLEPLQDFAKQHDCAVLLVHHTKKVQEQQSGQVEVFDTIRGSSAIRATARGAWILVAGERSHRLVVEHGHGRFDLEIYLNLATLTWTELGKWKPNANADQADLVLAYLEQHGEGTAVEIADAMAIPKKSCQVVLWRLQLDDLVGKRSGTGPRPAVYFRSVNKLSQINALLTLGNDCPDSDTGLRQQKNQLFSSEEVIKEIKLPDRLPDLPDLISDPKFCTPVVNTSSNQAEELVPRGVPSDNKALTTVNTEMRTQSKGQRIDQVDQVDQAAQLDPLPDRADQVEQKIDQVDQVTGTVDTPTDTSLIAKIFNGLNAEGSLTVEELQSFNANLTPDDRRQVFEQCDRATQIAIDLLFDRLPFKVGEWIDYSGTNPNLPRNSCPWKVRRVEGEGGGTYFFSYYGYEAEPFPVTGDDINFLSLWEPSPIELEELTPAPLQLEPNDLVLYTGKLKRVKMHEGETGEWRVQKIDKKGIWIYCEDSPKNSSQVVPVRDLQLVRPRPLTIQEVEVGGEYSCPSLYHEKVRVLKVIKSSKSVLVSLPFPLDPEKISVSWLGRLGWSPSSLGN